MQTLILTVALGLPVLLWVTSVSPHWLTELRFNLAMLSAHGHLNDPGPHSMAGHGIAMVIDLQSVVSVFRDDPRIYNSISICLCGALIAIWATITLRTLPTLTLTWLALASIAPLSMLPVYHRLEDSKLLLLTVPACALLWAEGRSIKWLAVGVTSAGILVTGELQWAAFLSLLKQIPASGSWLNGFSMEAAQVFPVPLTLLTVGVFYLCIYVKCASQLACDSTPKVIGRNLG